MDIPLFLLQLWAKVEKLSVNATSLFEGEFFEVSQNNLLVDVVFDEASELAEKGLPESILLDVVCAEVLPGSSNRAFGLEDVDVGKLTYTSPKDAHWVNHLLRLLKLGFLKFLARGQKELDL